MAKKAILARTTNKIKNLAINKAPYDTGILRKSITTDITTNYGKVGVGGDIKYAKIQEYGGTIRPKNKKLLAWKTKGGKWAFAKKVTIKPQPYLIPAGKQIANEFPDILVAELNKTTK
jgi:bacteriophage protein of unknown function (DUF646)|nr:MAG TPA: tail component [Caudoviricetes sp.]